MTDNLSIRAANLADLATLVALENRVFTSDKISRRSFRHALSSDNNLILVAHEASPTDATELLGYALLHLHKGTRLARLYSLAVAQEARGKGVAQALLAASEKAAALRRKIMMRLEVSEHNLAAISLYHKFGYREFGHYQEYYEDQSNALRMQKRIRYLTQEGNSVPLSWIQQGTPFTCGPASLQMSLAALVKSYQATQDDELQIWREATTIFMTSGHGGCHPMGLALAAKKRGAQAAVWISEATPLFVDGVRDPLKKDIVTRVHNIFLQDCQQQQIALNYQGIALADLLQAFAAGAIPIILISTYRMDGKKAPHWVVLSGYDDRCIYVHDPDPSSDSHLSVDCQYVPIARDDFEKMSRFGQNRLQAAVVLTAPESCMGNGRSIT